MVEADVTTVATEEVEVEVEVVARRQPSPLKGQNTQTCPLESGVDVKCTENSGAEHTFVLNQLHAHGRISTLHVPRNEVLTSLAAPIINQFMTHCTTTNESRK